MEPLSHESCGDRSAGSPGRYGGHWEVFGQGFGEGLHHGPSDTADLHPAFQDAPFLLPEIVDAPPAFEVMEDRFDLPAVAVEDNDFAGGQVGLGSEIETGRRPSLVFFVVGGAPYGADRMTVEKSCFDDDGLETDLLPFSVNMQRDDLGGQCGNVFRSELGPIFTGRPRWEVRGGGSRNSAVSLRAWPMNWPY